MPVFWVGDGAMNRFIFFLALTLLIVGCSHEAIAPKTIGQEKMPKDSKGKEIDVVQEARVKVEELPLEVLYAETKNEVREIIKEKDKLDTLNVELKAVQESNVDSTDSKAIEEKVGILRKTINQRAQRYNVYAAKIRKSGGEPPKIQDLKKEEAQKNHLQSNAF